MKDKVEKTAGIQSDFKLPLQMAGDGCQHDSEVHNGPKDKDSGKMIGGAGEKKKKKEVYEGSNIDEKMMKKKKKKKKKLKQGGDHSDITTVNTCINENEAGAGDAQLGESMMGKRKKEKKSHKTIQVDTSQDTLHHAHDDESNIVEGNNETAAFRAADAEERVLKMITFEAEDINTSGKKKKKRKRDEDCSEVTTITINVNENGVGAGEKPLEEGIMGNAKSLRKERKKEKKMLKDLKKAQDTKSNSCGDGSIIAERNDTNMILTKADDVERNLKVTPCEAEDVERNLKVTPCEAEDGNIDENLVKKKKKKKKKKDGDGSRVTTTRDNISENEGEELQLEGQDGDKLKRKSKSIRNLTPEKPRKKEKSAGADAETKDSSEESTPKKSSKRVRFAEEVEVLEDSLVRGKRFSPEEDEMVKKAVLDYISSHNLGEQGLDMVLHCKNHPEIKNCWKDIGLALPHRPYVSVYYRAHILFERDDKHHWTQEERELVCNFYAKHGADWKTLAKMLGKQRTHVKDFWRRICLPNQKKGKWGQDEYQELFDLVNLDLQVRALQEKKSTKHGMLRDDIPWTAISRKLQTRGQDICCMKWYEQLASPMVVEGKWADADDYRMLKALYELDACCMEDVDWNNLIEHRTGDVCRQRWNQMVKHLGEHRTKPFPDQLEVLTQRYCPDLLEAREAFDNLPVER